MLGGAVARQRGHAQQDALAVTRIRLAGQARHVVEGALVFEVCALRVGDQVRAGGIVHAGAVEQLAVGEDLHELGQGFALQIEHVGGLGVARDQVGALGGEDGLEVQRLDHAGRGQGGDVERHAPPPVATGTVSVSGAGRR